jgi:hypothetical protein
MRYLSDKNIFTGFLRFYRTPDDRFQLKHAAFENNNKNVVLDGIICTYVHKNKDVPGHTKKAYKGK